MAIIGFLFTALTILAEFSQDFDSATELFIMYPLALFLYCLFYLPLAAMGYYYVSLEYLVLYSDNGSKIKINTKKINNYSGLNDLLKKLL